MSHYEDCFKKMLGLIEKYHNLINCHLVDFLTEDLWEKCMPLSMKLDLEEISSKNFDIDWWRTDLSCELNRFKNIASSLKLDSCPDVMQIKDLSNSLKEHELHKTKDNIYLREGPKFMKDKKWHEVEIFSRVIANMRKSSSDLVIDTGSGKAYLSEHLSLTYDVPVVAIESSINRHVSALRRNKLIEKKKYLIASKVHYIMKNVDEATNYSNIVSTLFPDWNGNNNIILVGLHTCGSLSHFISKSFISSEDIKYLCVVPCCYHLMTESLTKRYVFSKNARMLAQQSIERVYSKNKQMSPTLFYRTILQVILKSMGLSDAKIGRGAVQSDFPSYAKWAFMKIGIPYEQMPSNDFLEQQYKVYVRNRWKFEVFQLLRMHLGPVLEAAIILDIVIYLQQSEDLSEVTLVQLFDPALSPRNHAIIARK